MNFQEFISTFDFVGAVVLLEGKREILPEDKDKLFQLGKKLASNTTHIIFRSGNAGGADEYYSKGVTAIKKNRMQVIAPYTNHRVKHDLGAQIISLDDITLAAESEIVYESKKNKKTAKLIDQYVNGKRDQYSIKAAYIIRDTIKVLGKDNEKTIGGFTIAPANAALFYDDLKNPLQGGTGHTMQVCIDKKIPFFDQRVWFEWLD